MRTLCFRTINFSLLLLAVLFIFTPAAKAATTFTVTTTEDNVVNDSICTLREAISAANESPANNNCGSGTGPYTIIFSISGTITLGSALPNIANNMTIDGSGRSITVSGNNSVLVFRVNSGSTVILTSLTVANGQSYTYGGGIENNGTLTVTNSTVTGNSAWFGGGIYNCLGTLTVTNSTISGNSASAGGGGIFNIFGTLSVTNSLILNNTAYSGGAIGNDEGLCNVTNSTISASTATYYGGGISNDNGTMSLTNNTISNNSATYGGGINSSGRMSLNNTIIAFNPSGGNCLGAISGSNNLANDGTCGSGSTNSPTINIGPLGNHGGSTQTIPLLPGSAALDAGDDDTCEAAQVSNQDQRGVRRPMGMHCDIGAFEYRGQVKLLPGGTIFNSIQDAYNSVSTGTITIEAEAYVIPDELLFDYNSNVNLMGGMDGSYNQTSGFSPVNKLTVENGQAVISNIIIKP
jgi:CSLREA domain-containing protein